MTVSTAPVWMACRTPLRSLTALATLPNGDPTGLRSRFSTGLDTPEGQHHVLALRFQ
ncbi:hypothetical protein [Streptomyces mirabilis]